jgi:transposase
MRFVPVKTEEQQALLMSHRMRDFLVRQLTQLANAIRAHLGEFGGNGGARLVHGGGGIVSLRAE